MSGSCIFLAIRKGLKIVAKVQISTQTDTDFPHKRYFLLLLPTEISEAMHSRLFNILGWTLSLLLLVSCTDGVLSDSKSNSESKQGYDLRDDTAKVEHHTLADDTLTVMERLMERGVLVAVTNCSEINFNMYNANPAGFEFELLKGFCDANHLKLEMLVNDNTDSCFWMLESGKVDVIATGMGLTKELKRKYFVTDPIFLQKSVLVQRMPSGWGAMSTENEVENQLLRSPYDLAGRTVHVTRRSHAVKMLDYLSEVIGDTVYVKECDTLNSIELIHAVHDGLIDYTIADEYIANIATTNLSGLDTKLAVSLEHPIGWVVRQERDSSLVNAINDWIEGGAEQKQMRLIMTRYLTNGRYIVRQREASNSRLSIYDSAIKREAAKIGWDWRLLAALIYQESFFKADLKSDKGAFGLMQLMPSVMQRFGIDYNSTPVEQLEAGGKLIMFLDKALTKKVADSTERVKFILAAYNAGLGHVLDAQRLAKKFGKQPDVWDDNVDYYILNKSKYLSDTCCKCGYLRGGETYRFVADIMDRYQNYRILMED